MNVHLPRGLGPAAGLAVLFGVLFVVFSVILAGPSGTPEAPFPEAGGPPGVRKAAAGGCGARGRHPLSSLDVNHDGLITLEEYLAPARRRFAAADRNGDGVISLAEGRLARAAQHRRPARRRRRAPRPYLAAFDRNHDGRVTLEEYLSRRRRRFAALDTNHDGVISRAEAEAAGRRAPARRSRNGGERLRRRGRPAPALAGLDANHDGRITLREFLAPRRKRFAALDANRDGAISLREGRLAAQRAGRPRGPADEPYLADLDVNHDGRVSRDEYLAPRRRLFAALDADHDGVISRREAEAARQARLERRARADIARARRNAGEPPAPLASLDANHDGLITAEEYEAPQRRLFARLDLDHDGAISRSEAEVAAAWRRRRQAAADARRRLKGLPVRPHRAASRPYLADLDANRDGRVTLDEFLARRRAAFAALDANHDGIITRAEAEAARRKRKGAGPRVRDASSSSAASPGRQAAP